MIAIMCFSPGYSSWAVEFWILEPKKPYKFRSSLDKLFKKYLIEQKNAKKRAAVLAVLGLSLYYGGTLR